MKDANKISRVIGFFAAKGLLIAPGATLYPNAKLRLTDVLNVARYYEPRVLEVLPAALLSFPRSFLEYEKLPEEFLQILNRIRKNENEGPNYRGIRYKDMKRWAELQLKDRRTKPLKEKKVLKSFRLSPKTISTLASLSESLSLTETAVLEDLVQKASKPA